MKIRATSSAPYPQEKWLQQSNLASNSLTLSRDLYNKFYLPDDTQLVWLGEDPADIIPSPPARKMAPAAAPGTLSSIPSVHLLY